MKYLILKSQPSVEEFKYNNTFAGPFGKLFNDILIKSEIEKFNPKIINWISKPYISTVKIKSLEFKNCLNYIVGEIKRYSPDLLIVMGDVVLKNLIKNRFLNVSENRGLFRYIEELKCTMFSTYDIYDVEKDFKYFNIILKDFKLAKSHFEEKTKVVTDYKICKNIDEVKSILNDQTEITFDIETTGLNSFEDRILSIAFSWAPGHALCLPIPEEFEWSSLKVIFDDPSKKTIAHNSLFDMIFLARRGVTISNLHFDTMLAYHLLNENEIKLLGLKKLARYYTDMGEYGSEVDIGHLVDLTEEQREKLYLYNCSDADCTFRLYRLFKPQLTVEKLDNLYYFIVVPFLSVLLKMKLYGIKIDEDYIQELRVKYETEINDLLEDIRSQVPEDFNINSVKDLRKILFDDLALESSEMTEKNFKSTNSKVLKNLSIQHDFPKKLLKYREIIKKLNTYLGNLKKCVYNGRVYPEFVQTGTVTGRLSCRAPNLQNIHGDTEIQNIFVATEGHTMVVADLSQAEFRIWAQHSKDERMIDDIRRGEDIHRATAATVFKLKPEDVPDDLRKVAKSVTFGLLYGMGVESLCKQHNLLESEAKSIIHTFFSRYPVAATWLKEVVARTRINGYTTTFFGRKRRLPGFHSPFSNQVAEAERQSKNSSIQGTVADYIMLSMIKLDKALALTGTRILLQIHDAIVFEVPDDEVEETINLIKQNMVLKLKNFNVKMDVEIKKGKRFGELENVN